MLASRHPQLVRRLVTSGAMCGWTEFDFTKSPGDSPADQFAAEWRWQEDYEQVSPDGPDHWGVVLAKLREMWLKPVYIEISELKKIRAPTLVISGDRRDVYIEESVEIFRTIPQAQLCILPGADHFTFQHKADWLNPIILAFLAAP
jgi:pimeloyl-ACP methyl ester carboxylesterase